LQRLRPAPGAIAQALNAISPGFQINLRALWEASNNRWNQWVLNYSQAKQLDLLRNIGFDAPTLEDLGSVLLGLLVGASLLGAAWTQWERTRQDPWLRLLQAARSKLQRAGLVVGSHTPPRQLVAALQAHAPGTPHDLQPIQDWLLRMEAWRYAGPSTAAPGQRAALGTLQRAYRQLHWPRHLPPTAPTP
jgi:hypothetical protein